MVEFSRLPKLPFVNQGPTITLEPIREEIPAMDPNQPRHNDEGAGGGPDDDEGVGGGPDNERAVGGGGYVRRRTRRKYGGGFDVDVRDINTGEVTPQRVDINQLRLWPHNLRVVVPFNALGQPVLKGGDLYNKWLSDIGHNFQLYRIDNLDWAVFTHEHKYQMFQDHVMRRFDVEPFRSHDAFKKMGESWKNTRLKLYRARDPFQNRPIEELYALVPETVPANQWRAYIDYRRGPRAMELSTRNTANVSRQRYRSASGATTIAVRMSIMEREIVTQGLQADAQLETFRESHMRLDGQWTIEGGQEIFEEMQRVRQEQIATQSEGRQVDPYMPYRMTIGQNEHPGRVRGLGYGPTPTQVWGRYYSVKESSSLGSRRRSTNIDVEEMRTQITTDVSARFEAQLETRAQALVEREREALAERERQLAERERLFEERERQREERERQREERDRQREERLQQQLAQVAQFQQQLLAASKEATSSSSTSSHMPRSTSQAQSTRPLGRAVVARSARRQANRTSGNRPPTDPNLRVTAARGIRQLQALEAPPTRPQQSRRLPDDGASSDDVRRR